MNFLQVIILTESFLCRLVGLYSPWIKASKCSVLCRIISVTIYIMPLIFVPFHRVGDEMYSGQVSYILANITIFLIVLEIYLTVFKYNNINRKNSDFQEFLFEEELFTKVTTKLYVNSLAEVTCFNQFLLLITKGLSIFLLIMRFVLRPMFVTFSGAIRALIVTSLLCQWSLCMHHLEQRALKLQVVVKTVLEPMRRNVFSLIKEKENRNIKKEKRMNLKRFDTFISEYRFLADQHRIINDYYGVHLMLHVSVTVYCLLLVWYGSWVCAIITTKCYHDVQSYLLIRAFTDLTGITLTALISESASQKVTNIQTSIFTMIKLLWYIFFQNSIKRLRCFNK